jgi:TfoX/Sxy family transcriptional regulator of competence genes
MSARMPSFNDTPPALVALFQAAMAAFPQANIRKTFGFPCAYVNERMAAGLYADYIFVRLGAGDEATLLQNPEARSFAPMDRPMTGYVVLPQAILDDAEQLQTWLGKALAHAAGLPPKPPKSPARKRP